MREQRVQQSIPRRASAIVADNRQYYTTRSASPHRGGHYAGLHPEDQPSYTTETRTRRPPQAETDEDISEERSRSSVVRYRPLYEERQERGVSPYHPAEQPQEQRRKSWVFYAGIAFLVMLVGWVLISLLGMWWQAKMDDWTYGNPRTYQIDQGMGHNGRTSHFIAINLHGELEVIETQKNHPEVTKIYTVVTLPEDQQYLPVTLTFQDLRGSGRLDMLVHYGNTEIPLYNDGTGFQMQPPPNQ